ncbi:MAG: DUF4287 domain-containing protein [Phenylobacterium sp.]|jgi:hypothetical protein|uniref:DUF5655 domain-containing protein n=1 Tax=Phenylobacterium sp. TaxID=1871053 RepID=UPI001B677784|nr:DUF5655 domain-containing protein [Phenylobacterium sp.]MBP7649043.1 DUF4287 domain-containing protein [Phenylobacterium sp.]MBP7815011.1 DUF4287 domain-containing protein [Phenylobacterium sp.]MBP9230199.1 DUF4287 domain-containing protein [Phenylobacterium sp.]MBP9754221.1 DUF4287 domain-containing protein [Phenylobacterium sp.]
MGEPENTKGLSPRQQKYFATARASLEKETGKTFDAWVVIARTCPETKTMTRIAWMKAHHGLGMNRANMVMSAAFPTGSGWDEPVKLREALWKDPAATAIFEAVERVATALPDVVTGQRKAFTGFSRNFQFASAKPLKGGQVVLGLAVPTSADPRLAEPKAEGWSERLKSKVTLSSPADVDAKLVALVRQAWEAS